MQEKETHHSTSPPSRLEDLCVNAGTQRSSIAVSQLSQVRSEHQHQHSSDGQVIVTDVTEHSN